MPIPAFTKTSYLFQQQSFVLISSLSSFCEVFYWGVSRKGGRLSSLRNWDVSRWARFLGLYKRNFGYSTQKSFSGWYCRVISPPFKISLSNLSQGEFWSLLSPLKIWPLFLVGNFELEDVGKGIQEQWLLMCQPILVEHQPWLTTLFYPIGLARWRWPALNWLLGYVAKGQLEVTSLYRFRLSLRHFSTCFLAGPPCVTETSYREKIDSSFHLEVRPEYHFLS